MEEFTVLKKGTEEIYYVLSLAATHDEVVILANIENGSIILTSLNDLSMNYEFNGKEEEQDDDEALQDVPVSREHGLGGPSVESERRRHSRDVQAERDHVHGLRGVPRSR